ncbi:MAG: PAS domain S-box protein [Chitinophagales bacterium]
MNSNILKTSYFEKLSELLLDNVSDAIISTDENFIIKTWNKAAEKIYDLTFYDVKDRMTNDIFGYEFLNDSLEISRKKLIEEGEWKGIVAFTRHDGKKVFLNASVTKLHNEINETIGFVAVNRDITDAYQLKDLLQNEQRLSFALEGAGDGVWEYNFQSKEVYYSPGYKKMLGFSEHEFLNDSQEWRGRIHPDDLALVVDVEEKYDCNQIQNHSLEYRLKQKSGNYIWVLDRGMVIEKTKEGKPGKLIGTQTNIDHQKRAEEKIRSFLESAPDAMVIANEKGIIEITNSQAEKLFEYDRQEMIGKPIEYLIPERYVDNHKTHRDIFSGGAQAREMGKGLELFARRKDGREIPVEVSLSPIFSEEGMMVSASIRDITERKRTEQKLFKAQQLLQSFMMNTPTMNWIMDENNCFRFWNNSYMKAFNLSPQHLGKSMYEIFPPGICDAFLENNWRVWNSGSALETIEEGVGPDGKKQIYQIFKFPLDPEEGMKLLGGVALDITSNIINQQQLRLSNERYDYVSKATSDAIWDWDIQTGIIYRGEGFRSLFGYTEMSSATQFRLDHIHPGDQERISEVLKKTLEENIERWQDEYLFQCADGTYKTILDKGFIIRNEKGQAIRMIGSMQDITEQRKLQEQLVKEEDRKKKEVLQAIIHAQERERHEISHELHDNVSQILTTCKLLLDTAVQRDDKRYLQQANENIQKAIDEIRNISHRLNPATLKYIGLEGSVNDLLNKINNTGSIKINFSYLLLDIDKIHDDIQLAVFRIIQEQLNNIIRHAEAKKVVIDLAEENRKIKLTITDDGKGYDLKVKKHGLGLRNIFNRAEFHKGTAQIFTEPGKGFKLQVQIPLHGETTMNN